MDASVAARAAGLRNVRLSASVSVYQKKNFVQMGLGEGKEEGSYVEAEPKRLALLVVSVCTADSRCSPRAVLSQLKPYALGSLPAGWLGNKLESKS